MAQCLVFAGLSLLKIGLVGFWLNHLKLDTVNRVPPQQTCTTEQVYITYRHLGAKGSYLPL